MGCAYEDSYSVGGPGGVFFINSAGRREQVAEVASAGGVEAFGSSLSALSD